MPVPTAPCLTSFLFCGGGRASCFWYSSPSLLVRVVGPPWTVKMGMRSCWWGNLVVDRCWGMRDGSSSRHTMMMMCAVGGGAAIGRRYAAGRRSRRVVVVGIMSRCWCWWWCFFLTRGHHLVTPVSNSTSYVRHLFLPAENEHHCNKGVTLDCRILGRNPVQVYRITCVPVCRRVHKVLVPFDLVLVSGDPDGSIPSNASKPSVGVGSKVPG